LLATSSAGSVQDADAMAKKRRKRRKSLEPLEAIKRLLILSLAKQSETTSEEVARVLENIFECSS
jgi:hypothetical protein